MLIDDLSYFYSVPRNVVEDIIQEMYIVQQKTAALYQNINVARNLRQEKLVRRRDHVEVSGLKDLGQR